MSLSIIIPVFNVSSYLKAAIDSVIHQITDLDEIIIVDDGSTDNSGELIDDLYSSHPQVIILHTQNCGLGGARNNGLRFATKDFVYYFDSDDILCNSLFDTFKKKLEKFPTIDLFVFSAESFHDTPSHGKLPNYDRGIDGLFATGEDAFSHLYSREKCYPNAWLYITRRKIITEYDLKFKSIIHEDEEYTPRLFKACGKVYVTKDVFFRRRIRVNSIMQSKYSERNIHGYIESIKSQSELFQNSSGVFKKMIRLRIINNLNIIYRIRESLNSPISPETMKEIEILTKQYNSFPVYLLKKHPYAFRLYRYIENKARKRIKISFAK